MAGESSARDDSKSGSLAMEFAKRRVSPATRIGSKVYSHTGYRINELEYEVPINHDERPEKITVTVRVILCREKDAPEKLESGQGKSSMMLDKDKQIAVYLVGGPGSDNPPTAHPALNEFYLDKGFQVLYMDYRGTGSSTLLRADDLSKTGFPSDNAQRGNGKAAFCCFKKQDEKTSEEVSQEQAAMLALFRQDNIVRDLEAVRMSLLKEGVKPAEKWTLVGQSYGGWISFTYLSFYPESLHMVIVTGGIPPVGRTATEVYKNTYKTTINACNAFYNKYPQHVNNVRQILAFIGEQKTRDGRTGMDMPGGGILTPERFLCLGRTLGTTDGEEKVDEELNICLSEINPDKATLSDKTLKRIEGWLRFEERPLYAILQEAIYTEPTLLAAWAAEEVGKKLPEYWWLNDGAFKRVFNPQSDDDKRYRKTHFDDERIYMSAEHIYRFHFDQFQALVPLKRAADILAQKQDWPVLFDTKQLARNKVPVSSLSYDLDMFIDWSLSRKAVEETGMRSIWLANNRHLMHTAVKDRSELVLGLLWDNLTKLVELKTDSSLSPKASDLINALKSAQ